MGTHAQLWKNLIPLIAVSGFFFILWCVYCVRCALRGIPRTTDLKRGGSMWLGVFFIEYWCWVINPVEKALVKTRISPNVITTFSMILSAGAGAAFAIGKFGLGGWLMIASGTCDMLDGRIARSRGITTQAGAFYDSTLDRYAELLVLSGLAFYWRGSMLVLLPLFAMIGSVMVSYTKARGEGLGVQCRVGGMERPERVVYIAIGSVFSSLLTAITIPGHPHAPQHLAIAAVAIVAVFSNHTALRRLAYIYGELRRRDGKETEADEIMRAYGKDGPVYLLNLVKNGNGGGAAAGEGGGKTGGGQDAAPGQERSKRLFN